MAKRTPITPRVRFEILKRDGFACQFCGMKAPEAYLQVDHIVPVAMGGTDDPNNLIAACWSCNNGKRAIPLSPERQDLSASILPWRPAGYCSCGAEDPNDFRVVNAAHGRCMECDEEFEDFGLTSPSSSMRSGRLAREDSENRWSVSFTNEPTGNGPHLGSDDRDPSLVHLFVVSNDDGPITCAICESMVSLRLPEDVVLAMADAIVAKRERNSSGLPTN